MLPAPPSQLLWYLMIVNQVKSPGAGQLLTFHAGDTGVPQSLSPPPQVLTERSQALPPGPAPLSSAPRTLRWVGAKQVPCPFLPSPAPQAPGELYLATLGSGHRNPSNNLVCPWRAARGTLYDLLAAQV
ncbi:Hypothetical predicted protein [Marmota monax]|uniref:Uncharacterized protein n=1 Tax=Marmota monax TaxID=9995 RepID=A0A5E4BVV2_MARMO|nr:Hypothetical predicted protein [Marmota monax]